MQSLARGFEYKRALALNFGQIFAKFYDRLGRDKRVNRIAYADNIVIFRRRKLSAFCGNTVDIYRNGLVRFGRYLPKRTCPFRNYLYCIVLKISYTNGQRREYFPFPKKRIKLFSFFALDKIVLVLGQRINVVNFRNIVAVKPYLFIERNVRNRAVAPGAGFTANGAPVTAL